MTRWWSRTLFALLCFAVLAALIGTSESFENCIRDRKNHEPYHALNEKGRLFVKTITRSKLHIACARVTTGENDGAVAALATVVVAFFTFTLWRATSGLLRSAQAQSADTKASIEQATRAATAMEQISESIASSAASAAQAVTATQESIANNKIAWRAQMRAYLGVIPGTLIEQDDTTGVRIELQPWIVNNGLTPAHNVRYNAVIEVMSVPIPSGFGFELPPVGPAPSTLTLGPRQQIFMITFARDMLAKGILAELKASSGRRVCIYGTVTYNDVFWGAWYTNFCYFLVWGTKNIPAWIHAHVHNDST